MTNTKYIFSGVIVFLIAAVEANAQQIQFQIMGNVGHYSAPAKAYLMYQNEKGRQVDSAAVNNGVFVFNGTIDKPKQATVFLNTKGNDFMTYDAGFLNIYLEKGELKITSQTSLDKADIVGGPLNSDFAEYNKALSIEEPKYKKLDSAMASASPEKQKSSRFMDSLINETLRIEDDKKPIALGFIKKHRSSPVSLVALNAYAGLYPDSRMVEPAFNLLNANVRESKEGLDYANTITKMKKSAIGVIAPDFTLTDTLGNPVSLHDFKGKYVLVDFWASWCVPCRAESPNLIKAFETYKNKNFTILSVSADNERARNQWIKAIKEDRLLWTQAADLKTGFKNAAMEIYSIESIPQNVLISPEGRIIDKNLRGEGLTQKLAKLFNH